VGTMPFWRTNRSKADPFCVFRNTRDQPAYSAHIDGSMSRTTCWVAVSEFVASVTLSRMTVTDAAPFVTSTVAYVTKVTPRGSGFVNVTTSRAFGSKEMTCGGSESNVVASEGVIAR